MKNIRAFLSGVVVLAAAYLLIARTVDPYGSFLVGSSRRFPVLTWNFWSEAWTALSAYRAAGPVQGLIMGTSRSCSLDASELGRLTGKRFFNFSAGNESIENDLDIYHWLRGQGEHLEALVIGLDIENIAFSGSADLAWTHPIQRTFKKYNRLFTLTGIQDVKKAISLTRHPLPERRMSFRPDGTCWHRDEEGERAAGTFNLDEKIAASRGQYVDRFADLRGLSRRRKAYLETLVREAKADGATVVIWLTPIHPVTAQHLTGKTRYPELLEAARAYLRELQATMGVRTFDWSEPDRFGGDLTGWYDGAHMDESNFSRISVLLARALNAHDL